MFQGFDVMIIGAGAAGLAAARDLSVAGHKVVVLEARDRIGGRIFTLNDSSSPIPIELGAEFVHGKPPEVCDIAQLRRLKLSQVSGRHWYFENGKLRKSDQFWATIEKLNERMESVATDQSLNDFLSTLPDDEETQRVRDLATLYVEGFHAASSDRIGIRGLIKANEAAESIEGDKSFRFLDGYDSLVEALRAEAETHGAAIHLNTVVKEIRWSSEGVEAICDDDRSFGASQAVITLPLGVLQARTLRFSPELPPEKQAAINNLAMGHVLRIVLHFRERFWETLTNEDEDGNTVKFADAAFIHADGLAFPTWWTQLPVRAPVLVGWVGGPEADRITAASHDVSNRMERTGITLAADSGTPLGSFVTDQAIASLAQIFNLSTDYILDQLATVYFHDWQHDQFSRGAYGYVPVDGLDDQITLAQPVDGILFFAGEATTAGHIGTVHGAIMSGQRAAREILAS